MIIVVKMLKNVNGKSVLKRPIIIIALLTYILPSKWFFKYEKKPVWWKRLLTFTWGCVVYFWKCQHTLHVRSRPVGILPFSQLHCRFKYLYNPSNLCIYPLSIYILDQHLRQQKKKALRFPTEFQNLYKIHKEDVQERERGGETRDVT